MGSAFIELLYEQREHLAKHYKFKPKVIAVIARRGTALSKTGFKRAAEVKFDGKAILYEKAIREADVIVEVTPTDVQTGGIALEHCRVALKMGKHVVTANKGPLVVAYRGTDVRRRAHDGATTGLRRNGSHSRRGRLGCGGESGDHRQHNDERRSADQRCGS
ncbi:MAG: hypothetical protein HY740_01705 [Chloroflexi bacterium]|nr:hypothetical protein [Chloroflexota bacterium]